MGPLGVKRIVNTSKMLIMKPGKLALTASDRVAFEVTESTNSGTITKVRAPITTPGRVAIPAITAPVKIENERVNGKALGETVEMVIANIAPARPATAALIVKASTCFLDASIPCNSAAVRLMRIARQVLPYLERIKIGRAHV